MNRFFLPIVLCILAASYLLYASAHIISTSAPDFYVYYYAGRDFLRGVNPYSDTSLYTLFTYPPVSLLLLSVWALLPIALSQGIFIVLSSLCILVLPYIVLRSYKSAQSLLLISFATVCFVYSFPTKFTLGMGQINAIAFLILILGMHYPRKMLVSSFVITIACILKPVLALCLLVYVIRREWRMIMSIVVWGLLSIVVSYAFVGHNIFIYYIDHIIPHLSSVMGREVYYNQGLLGFISRLTLDMNVRSMASLAGSIFILTITIWNCIKKNDFQYQLSLILTTLLIVDTLSWQHHFVFLLYPMLFIAIRSRQLMSLGTLGLSYILVSINISEPILYRNWPSLLALSHGFYGALLIWCVLIFGEYALKVRE